MGKREKKKHSRDPAIDGSEVWAFVEILNNMSS
jgi:hypothetical protein